MRADASSAPNGEGVLAWLRSLRGGRRDAERRSPWRGDDGNEPTEWRAPRFLVSRKVVPTLVLLFLLTLAAARLSITLGDRYIHVDGANHSLSTITELLSTNLKLMAANGAPFDPASFVNGLSDRKVLPANVLLFVTDRDGMILASIPEDASRIGTSVYNLVSDPRELLAVEEARRIHDIGFMGDRAIAASAALPSDEGRINVFWPEKDFLAGWRQKTAISVSLFVLTGTILLLVLNAYFRQSRRAENFSGLFAEAHQRVDMALSRGKCGLWDWDIGRGQMYWSRSMYEILGMEPTDGVIPFSEIAPLMHPDDGGLFHVARSVAEGRIDHLDQMFRMRRADGEYVWIRGRANVTHGADGDIHLIGIAVDVSEQRELARRTDEANHRLKNTIENISETFLLCDSEGKVVICNSIYRKTFGLDEEDVAPGTPIDKVLRKARRPIRAITLDSGDAGPGESAEEAQMPDGRWLLISARRMVDGGTVWVGTDITQIKHHKTLTMDSKQKLLATIAKLEAATEDAERKAHQLSELNVSYMAEKERAESASRAKTAFLANMSHELRTPLNAILGFSDIIRQRTFGEVGERYGEYVDDIYMSGSHLLRMIDDVLEMATIESGRLELMSEEVEFSDIVRESAAMVEPLARKKGIALTIEAPETLALISDRRATSQVVLNLLSNAVKFAPEAGEVRLRLRKVGDTACLSILDNGPGIPKSALATLGMPFAQVGSELVRAKCHGTGLGIPIAKALVALHGGRLRILSQLGSGTLVSLRLPVESLAASTQKPQNAIAQPGKKTTRRRTARISRAAA
ncbi:PAS domain-containing sensor histidine kinase [Jiella mangrovi]|uniref:histidine kinase n=1 Tax=Jiella mangrovi TaxID=2821407 RepID=A0ABS4BDB5_9HYPH|nr:PAS domain-containing sensor histidine kinase [Jiella mangrovi]MBP0614747.1 PAS domain-containing protein [Jiella mangrovi]